MRNRLRLYVEPEHDSPAAAPISSPPKTVRVTLAEIFPLLADAVQSQRTWLRDFADDELTISADLYEVLLAYQHHRRAA